MWGRIQEEHTASQRRWSRSLPGTVQVGRGQGMNGLSLGKKGDMRAVSQSSVGTLAFGEARRRF